MVELMPLRHNLIPQWLEQAADQIISTAALQDRDSCAQWNRGFGQLLLLFAPAAQSAGEDLGYCDAQKR
jgi:hypothetical protein